MSSLVTEVLLQAGKLDKDDLQTKVSKLTSASDSLKIKIDDFINKKYEEFNPQYSSCQTLLANVTGEQEEAKEIQGSLSGVVRTELQDSTSEFERLSEEHSRASELLHAMGKTCQISDLFESFTNGRTSRSTIDTAKLLLEMQSHLENIKGSYLNDHGVFKFLRNQLTLVREEVIYGLDEKWMNYISWSLPPKDGDQTQVILKLLYLDIESGSITSECKELQDLIYSLSMLGRLKPKVQRLAEMIMKYIITPMIDGQNLKPDFRVDAHKFMNVSLSKTSSEKATLPTEGLVTPSSLFRNVIELLKCLNNNLLSLRNNEDGTSDTVMVLFSEHIRDDLIQLLIEKCLSLTIPKSAEELQNYKVVEDVVRNFESSLAGINFIPFPEEESGGKLMSYAMNVSFHFANQRCIDILQQARALMKKGNQNTELVSDKNFGADIHQKSDNVIVVAGTDFDSQKPGKLLSDDTLRFPDCHVSVCAMDIMKLAYKTMNEALQSDPVCAVRLVATTQNIFELYYTSYPVYHKDSLENIPLFSAIFLNDCMYIAHHLLTFGHQFAKSQYACKSLRVLTFVDKTPLLRQLGAECFLKQMRKQKDIMIQCLDPIKTFSSVDGQDKYKVAEKAVKQILYQLNHLKKVWSGVLQPQTFQRALCTLVNSCVSNVTLIICAMEDISSDDSISLKHLCVLLSDQIPHLFENDNDGGLPDLTWQKQVPKWHRLQELIGLLSASLREIVDRWSEGNGPLANAFAISEVKGLIRALFQNTEHRAQAISKIRL